MKRKVAYIMSRFPKVTETFILYEILALKGMGLEIEIFPLVRQRETVEHPEVRSLMPYVHYYTLLSWAVVAAQLYWLGRSPRTYLQTWAQVIRGNFRSPKFLSRALVTMPMAALFAREMQGLGIEHVHAHWATHPALAAFVIKQLTGISYSVTAHAHDIYVEQTMLEEKLSAAEFVTTISEYNQHFLQDLYPELNKPTVIHCGIDVERFKPLAQRGSNEPFTIICVASLEEKKGHRYLLEALALLMTEEIPIRCIVVGEGETRPEIEAQIASLGLQNVVSLLGRQTQQRVRELLSHADVMVLPSVVTAKGKKEGIPVVLMEAMAMEVPVVATAISGIPELVADNHTGLLVPERDAAKLADAISRLFQDPALCRRLAANGRAWVVEEFNLDENAKRLFALLTTGSGVLPIINPNGKAQEYA